MLPSGPYLTSGIGSRKLPSRVSPILKLFAIPTRLPSLSIPAGIAMLIDPSAPGVMVPPIPPSEKEWPY